jgi:hypothetical protein
MDGDGQVLCRTPHEDLALELASLISVVVCLADIEFILIRSAVTAPGHERRADVIEAAQPLALARKL